MPLTANLSASFTAGGFDLGASFTGLTDIVASVGLPTLSFAGDAEGLDLSGLTLDGVLDALMSVVDDLGNVSGALPDLDAVLAPLHAALELLDIVGSGEFPALVASLEAAVGAAGPGLPALFDAAGQLGQVPAVRSIVDLVGPLGLDLRAPGALIGGPAGGLISLVQLLGALLGVDTASREIEDRARLAIDLLQIGRINALVASIGTGTGVRLARLLDGIEPDDVVLVDLVARPIELYVADVNELLTLLVRGLAFSEATLVDADFAELAVGLGVASVALSSSALAPVHELVATLSGWAQPFLDVDIPVLGIDAVWGATATLASQIEAAVAAVAPSALRQAVDPLLDPILAPVRAVRSALDELGALLATVLDPVRQALDSIDLTTVTDTIHSIVGPVSDLVDTVDGLIGGATTEVEALVATVDGLLDPVRDALTTAKVALAEPFDAVSSVLDGLALDELNERATATLTSVADALGSMPIQPVFDVATGIISTAADALGLVPKALLPDDLKSALEAACAPVEALDLEPIRTELHTRLDAIISSLDTTVLTTLEAGYAEVREFIDSVNPRPLLEGLESEAFAALTDGLDQLDPSVVLGPVVAALDTVRAALDAIDLVGLLAPADDALDSVVAVLEQVSPAQLLAPVDELLSGVHEEVESTLGLSTWLERLDTVELAFTDFIERLDPAPPFAAMRSGWGDLVESIRPQPGGTGLTAGVMGAVLGGLPFKTNPGGIGEVIAWIRSERDGTTVVHTRLASAATMLESARDAVGALDIRALTAELDSGHRAVSAAVAVHPEGSLLRARLDPSILAASPTGSLAVLLSNVERVQTAFATAAATATATTAPDRSEVTLVASGLGVSFAPLTPVIDHARALLSAIGADSATLDPRVALADLLTSVGPDAVLGPIEAVASSLIIRVGELFREGVLGPFRDGVTELQDTLGALNVDQLTGGVGALHQQLIDKVDSLRPSVALAEPLELFDDVRSTLAAFDPYAPVLAAIDALQALIAGFVDEFTPTVVLAPVLTVYDQLAALIGGFDLAAMLEPILTRLRAIGGDVDRGMDEVIDALVRLQQACESDGGPIPGLDLSIAGSVDVGGAFGL